MESIRLASSMICALLLSGAFAMPAAAQSFQGGVRGTVRDAAAIIPGATLQLINEANGTTRETVTNEVGEYSFPVVEPTRYTIRVEVPGFKIYENKAIQIGTQQFINLDILLEVGSIEENITVTAAVPLIETSNASQGAVLQSPDFQAFQSASASKSWAVNS